MKRGRPKSIDKKRTKCIRFTTYAATLIEDIRKVDKNFDLSKFLSEYIVQTFGKNMQENIIKDQIGNLNKQKSEIESLIKHKVNELEKLRGGS